MIQVRNLTKDYGQLRAVDDISFKIPDKEIVGFLGPNGAGKTTTLKMITCFMPPTKGNVYVDDLDIFNNSIDIREKIGYLPEGCPIYYDMNVVDFLVYMAKLKRVNKHLIPKRIKEMIETYALENVVEKEISELSKGYRQRVGLACASIHHPDILIFDEPTVGLDPNQIVEIRSLIKRLGKEKTVIVSTHILREVEAICDKVIIIDKGKIIADGDLSEIQSSFRSENRIYLEIKADTEMILEELDTFKEIESAQLHSKDDNVYKLFLNYPKDKDIRADLYNFIKPKDWTILEMRTEQQSLEDVFRKLTESSEEDSNE